MQDDYQYFVETQWMIDISDSLQYCHIVLETNSGFKLHYYNSYNAASRFSYS